LFITLASWLVVIVQVRRLLTLEIETLTILPVHATAQGCIQFSQNFRLPLNPVIAISM